MNLKRAEVYFTMIDIVKALKLRTENKETIKKLKTIETHLNSIVGAEIVKE